MCVCVCVKGREGSISLPALARFLFNIAGKREGEEKKKRNFAASLRFKFSVTAHIERFEVRVLFLLFFFCFSATLECIISFQWRSLFSIDGIHVY